jgi:hypothetical protein
MKSSLSTIFTVWMSAALLLSGCSQMPNSANQGRQQESRSVERIESLGGEFQTPRSIGPSQSRVVVYRTSQNQLPGTTGIFMDGRYHASLEAGAWSSLCYKTGPVEVGARQMLVGRQPKDLMDTISAVTLTRGHVRGNNHQRHQCQSHRQRR